MYQSFGGKCCLSPFSGKKYKSNVTRKFILVFNQLDAQNLFHNKFYFMLLHVSSTYAHYPEVKIVLHSLWYHHTYRWPSRARDGHEIKLIVKQILFIKLVKYWDKYIEMHGQQNVKIVTRKVVLTLTLLTWRIWWAPNNASRWQMRFNSAFKGVNLAEENQNQDCGRASGRRRKDISPVIHTTLRHIP